LVLKNAATATNLPHGDHSSLGDFCYWWDVESQNVRGRIETSSRVSVV
jgi:hypothetical protein